MLNSDEIQTLQYPDKGHFYVRFNKYIDYIGGRDYTTEENGDVCYGGIRSWAYSENAGLDRLIVYYNPYWFQSKELTQFVLSEEMFGKAFLTKGIEEGFKNGFELNLSLPYHFLLGAMITLRYTFNERFALDWKEFKNVGASDLEALFMADRIIEGNEKYKKFRFFSSDKDIFPSHKTLKSVSFPKILEGPPSEEKGYLTDFIFWHV